MSTLTDELKAEHAFVAKVLEEVREVGIMSKEGQEKFISVKDGLLGHLAKEDAQLYPKLKKAADRNVELGRTLRSFSDEMVGLSEAIVAFFDKYIDADQSLEEGFFTDYTKILGALKVRIGKEEAILYEEYDKLEA